MKRIIATLLIVATLGLTACGNDMVIGGKNYSTYGLINADQEKDPNIKYKVIVGNIIWSVILIETIAAPVYFLGFSLYQPIGSK